MQGPSQDRRIPQVIYSFVIYKSQINFNRWHLPGDFPLNHASKTWGFVKHGSKRVKHGRSDHIKSTKKKIIWNVTFCVHYVALGAVVKGFLANYFVTALDVLCSSLHEENSLKQTVKTEIDELHLNKETTNTAWMPD